MDRKKVKTGLVLVGGVILILAVVLSPKGYKPPVGEPVVIPGPDTDFTRRQLVTLTLRGATSSLQNCYAAADEAYFDVWSLKCEAYYEEHRTENYLRCLSLATTSANRSNIYNEVKMIKRPHPDDCKILKEANVFPTDCTLPDGRGKEDTLRWQKSISTCNEQYGTTQ